MELQDLRCFMAVAQQLNFTRAAEWLHVTQPTLSRRIRDREVFPQTVDFVSGRCLEHGFSLHAGEYVRSAEDVFMRVASGKGVAFAHSMARLLDDADALGVRALEIADEDMTLAYAVARREGDENPAVAAYIDIARRLAKR